MLIYEISQRRAASPHNLHKAIKKDVTPTKCNELEADFEGQSAAE